jgi:radical SAM superfamily enzyme YgiQ (UPF0313 family)
LIEWAYGGHAKMKGRRKFFVEMIKPSHYDDDGYVIQWAKAWIPSNSLACLYGILLKFIEDGGLGDDIEIVVNAYDETNTVIPIKRICRRLNQPGASGIVCMVGVQSNQFPRSMHIARQFKAQNIDVAIGGFHVSGCMAMLDKLPADIQAARDLGVVLFAGEAEGRFGNLLKDAYEKKLQPVYNYMADLPGLEDQPVPILPRKLVQKYGGGLAGFDAGRGCPFQCSFCTIINVQGRKSRYRSADDIEKLVRANVEQGICRFFITDDNFARNKNWEAIFDRLGDLREEYNLPFSLIIQVDTLCHRIPNFISKAKRAGIGRVFIGLENINPDNLIAAKKRQNKITEYRKMLQAWREQKIITYAGYILGFPADTPQRIERDIKVIQEELPVDILEFFCLTPLPGSEDHKNLTQANVAMDSDMNIYDLEHVCTGHEAMTKQEWADIYRRSWDLYYSPEHIKTLMRRAIASGNKAERIWAHTLQFYGCIKYEKVHPLQGGYFRRKIRTQRREDLPQQNLFLWYPKRLAEVISTYVPFIAYAIKLRIVCERVKREMRHKDYTDKSLENVIDAETEDLQMFELTSSAKQAVSRARKQVEVRRKIKAATR